jgi:hypothetical protein
MKLFGRRSEGPVACRMTSPTSFVASDPKIDTARTGKLYEPLHPCESDTDAVVTRDVAYGPAETRGGVPLRR